MNKVVHLVPESYRECLLRFEEDRKLATFLSALDAIASVTIVDDSAVAVWQKLADTVKSEAPLTEVRNWVAKYHFRQLEAPPKGEGAESEAKPEEERPRIDSVGAMAAQADLALKSELEGLWAHNPVYGRFSGVLPFLRRSDAPWFGAISEPAKVIGAFIESLYPEDAVSPERAPAADQPWLGGYVAETLLPWAISREEGGKSKYSEEALSRIEAFVPLIPILFERHFDFFDPEAWGDQFDPESVVGALIHLPQAMFDRVLQETSWDPMRNDLEFPVDPDQAGKEERAARAIVEIFELVSVLPISTRGALSWRSIPSSVEHHFHVLAKIEQVPRMSWGLHKHWAVGALLCGAGDYTVPDFVAHVGCLSSGSPFDEEDLARSLRRLALKLGRLDPYRSVASVGYGDCGFVGGALSSAMEYVNVDSSSVNFVLFLGQDDTFGFGDEVSVGSPELLGMASVFPRHAVNRSRIFRGAIDSAFEGGFMRLGCALTAFYLPTQVLAYEDSAAFDWAWLAQAIDRAQQLDEEGHVQASVEATVQILDGLSEGETSQSVHRMNLSRFLAESRSRGSIDKDELKQSLLELREDQDVRAERLLEGYIGTANVRWMEGKDKAVLRELVKETARARDEGQLVCGSPVPGMLLTQWFKFLEERLVRVYDGIVTTECGPNPHREFGVKGSVADRLAVLEGKGGVKAQRLDEIRDSLPPGLRDDDVLDFLQRFRRERNKAAHEETPVLPGAFEEIFQEMVDGRLREFVEGVLL